MEIKIKNTTSEKQRAVIFGYSDDCWGKQQHRYSEPNFYNIKTDEGIEIEFDGRSSMEYRLMCVKSTSHVLKLKSVEYTSNFGWNKIKYGNFKTLVIDANGQHLFTDVMLQIFFTSTQESEYPLIINGERNVALRGIDSQTSWLLILEPNEEITLKLNGNDESSEIDRWAKVGAFHDKLKPKK